MMAPFDTDEMCEGSALGGHSGPGRAESLTDGLAAMVDLAGFSAIIATAVIEDDDVAYFHFAVNAPSMLAVQLIEHLFAMPAVVRGLDADRLRRLLDGAASRGGD